jgi:hypothetical protein
MNRHNTLFHLYLSGNNIIAKVMPSLILGNNYAEKFLASLDTTPFNRIDSTDVFILKVDAEDSPETFERTYHKGRSQSPQAFMEL